MSSWYICSPVLGVGWYTVILDVIHKSIGVFLLSSVHIECWISYGLFTKENEKHLLNKFSKEETVFQEFY